jgi:DNA invertase Pin-like site-specific DNA recombinase
VHNVHITKSISRFARNVVDCLTVVNELKKHNVEVYFETDNISSFDPKIDFVISLLASMAEEESKNTSENVKWNVRSKNKAI